MFELDEKYLYPHKAHTGHIPPEKPRYTMTEEVEYTAREMKNTIQRLLNFEHRLKSEVDEMMKHVSSDNVIFKQTFSEAHNLFLQEVKNEVNTFEGNIDASIRVFMENLTSDYSNLSEDTSLQITEYKKEYEQEFRTLTENLQTQYNSFVEAVNSRIDVNNETMGNAFQDYCQKLTTNINMFEADINLRYSTFTNSINEAFETFKTTWTQIVEERLNTQDGKLSDAEMYMKTNLVATITSLIGDMHEAGEFVEIIEGEVFNDLQGKIPYINVASYGVIGDGSTDCTVEMQTAINDNYGKTLFIPDGVYILGNLEIKHPITIIGSSHANVIFKYTGTGKFISIIPENPENYQQFLRVNISNITIENEQTNYEGTAIYINQTTHSCFDNIHIKGKFSNGFEMNGESEVSPIYNSLYNNVFKNINIKSCLYGFNISGCFSDNHFTNLSIAYGGTGFYIHDLVEGTQPSCNISLTKSTFVMLENSCFIAETHNLRNIYINEVNFEQFGEKGVSLLPTEIMQNVTITNCSFLPKPTATVCVHVKNYQGGIISNLLFMNNSDSVCGVKTENGGNIFIDTLIPNNGSTISHEIGKTSMHSFYKYVEKHDTYCHSIGLSAPVIISTERGIVTTAKTTTEIKALSNVANGCCMFDATLNKPLWHYNNSWYDATGTEV